MAPLQSPSSRIETLKGALVSNIEAILPQLKECRAIGGRFNIDELEKRSIRAPAVLIGVLKSPVKQSADGSVDVDANIAAFCLTEGNEEKRDAACWVMAEAIAAMLSSTKHWGVGGFGQPTRIDIEPVISADTRSRGVTLVAVTFSNTVRNINAGVFTDQGHVPTELYVNDQLEDSHDGVQP